MTELSCFLLILQLTHLFISLFLPCHVIHLVLVCLLQPGAVLAGVGGLAFFLHYNDERRAIPKGYITSTL